MSQLRKWQLRTTVAGHFGVIALLAGGALGSPWLFYAGGAVILAALAIVITLWLIMWRRGE